MQIAYKESVKGKSGRLDDDWETLKLKVFSSFFNNERDLCVFVYEGKESSKGAVEGTKGRGCCEFSKEEKSKI